MNRKELIEKAIDLLQNSDDNVFKQMLDDLGFTDDVLFELASESLEELEDNRLQNFIEQYE